MPGVIDRIGEGRPAELVDAARLLYDIVASSEHGLRAQLKWGQATFALDDDFHHWVCAIGITKRATGLAFHYGGILDDPDGLLVAGSSKLLRKLEFMDAAKVDRDVVLGFVFQAVDRREYFMEHWRELK